MQFALIIISRCGFGHPLSWDFSKDALGSMSFAQALAIVAHNHIARLILPQWVYRFPIERYADICTSFGYPFPG